MVASGRFKKINDAGRVVVVTTWNTYGDTTNSILTYDAYMSLLPAPSVSSCVEWVICVSTYDSRVVVRPFKNRFIGSMSQVTQLLPRSGFDGSAERLSVLPPSSTSVLALCCSKPLERTMIHFTYIILA